VILINVTIEGGDAGNPSMLFYSKYIGLWLKITPFVGSMKKIDRGGLNDVKVSTTTWRKINPGITS
jgi:hypothetical protein